MCYNVNYLREKKERKKLDMMKIGSWTNVKHSAKKLYMEQKHFLLPSAVTKTIVHLFCSRVKRNFCESLKRVPLGKDGVQYQKSVD